MLKFSPISPMDIIGENYFRKFFSPSAPPTTSWRLTHVVGEIFCPSKKYVP